MILWVALSSNFIVSLGKVKLENGIMSKDGVAIYDDSNSLIIEQNGDIHARENVEKDIYVFAYGNDYKRCLKDFYKFHLHLIDTIF